MLILIFLLMGARATSNNAYLKGLRLELRSMKR